MNFGADGINGLSFQITLYCVTAFGFFVFDSYVFLTISILISTMNNNNILNDGVQLRGHLPVYSTDTGAKGLSLSK